MESKQFTYHSTVKLRDTDAAGLLFFSNIFNITHDAYEAFMDHAGVGIGEFIKEKKYMLPIVHAEADYKKSQFVGDKLVIFIQCEKIGKSSYTLLYNVLDQQGETTSIVKTVHVVLEKKTRAIVSVPKKLRGALQSIH